LPAGQVALAVLGVVEPTVDALVTLSTPCKSCPSSASSLGAATTPTAPTTRTTTRNRLTPRPPVSRSRVGSHYAAVRRPVPRAPNMGR
jgi:hypothetical protein